MKLVNMPSSGMTLPNYVPVKTINLKDNEVSSYLRDIAIFNPAEMITSALEGQNNPLFERPRSGGMIYVAVRDESKGWPLVIKKEYMCENEPAIVEHVYFAPVGWVLLKGREKSALEDKTRYKRTFGERRHVVELNYEFGGKMLWKDRDWPWEAPAPVFDKNPIIFEHP